MINEDGSEGKIQWEWYRVKCK